MTPEPASSVQMRRRRPSEKSSVGVQEVMPSIPARGGVSLSDLDSAHHNPLVNSSRLQRQHAASLLVSLFWLCSPFRATQISSRRVVNRTTRWGACGGEMDSATMILSGSARRKDAEESGGDTAIRTFLECVRFDSVLTMRRPQDLAILCVLG
jgi:hypothetical protein